MLYQLCQEEETLYNIPECCSVDDDLSAERDMGNEK